MARKATSILCLLALALLVGSTVQAGPGPEAGAPGIINYQGYLTGSDGNPINDTPNVRFELYEGPSGGTLLWAETHVDVPVVGGYFSVLLGSQGSPLSAGYFSGTTRWLQVGVDTGSGFVVLPRQQLAAVPYAFHAQEAANAWALTGNSGTVPGMSYLGTSDNQALELKVNGTRVLRLEPDATSPNVIAGYSGNSITSAAYGVTIGGGGDVNGPNIVTDNYGVVGGGRKNQAGDATGDPFGAWLATVGGGGQNTASGDWSTISGGGENTASGSGSTISGGGGNIASGIFSTVSGGVLNNAAGERATIPGGSDNEAQGIYSFAAGYRAHANRAGCFAWADSTDADWTCDTPNLFAVRATGGVVLHVDTAGGGLRLTPADDGYGTLVPNVVAGAGGNTVTAGAYGAAIAGGGGGTWPNLVTDAWGTVGGGSDNQAGDNAGTVDDAPYATISGGQNNWATGPDSTVGGGVGNDAWNYAATVAGGESNRASGTYASIPGGSNNLAEGDSSFAAGYRAHAHSAGCFVWADSTNEVFDCNTPNLFTARATGGVALNVDTSGGGLHIQPNATSPNVIAGYGANTVTAGAYGATVAGGGVSGAVNQVTDNMGTVAGGQRNQAGDGAGTTSDRAFATVGGGGENTAGGYASTVAGGTQNSAAGSYGAVPGGQGNAAAGNYSFAAGHRAKANSAGCFAWGDSTDADVTCSTPNQWVARTSGGAYFYSNTALTAGVYLAPGGGGWGTVSDRNLKENVAGVDAHALLERLAQVPVTTWNYKSQDDSIRHIGPMAQDFYAAFSVGEDNTHITTVDADGVALAAIQALYSENQALRAKHAVQQAQITSLEQQNADLDARLTALEQAVQGGRPPQAVSRLPLPWLLAGGLVVTGGGIVAGRQRHRRA